jgi:hypothetical protein
MTRSVHPPNGNADNEFLAEAEASLRRLETAPSIGRALDFREIRVPLTQGEAVVHNPLVTGHVTVALLGTCEASVEACP